MNTFYNGHQYQHSFLFHLCKINPKHGDIKKTADLVVIEYIDLLMTFISSTCSGLTDNNDEN